MFFNHTIIFIGFHCAKVDFISSHYLYLSLSHLLGFVWICWTEITSFSMIVQVLLWRISILNIILVRGSLCYIYNKFFSEENEWNFKKSWSDILWVKSIKYVTRDISLSQAWWHMSVTREAEAGWSGVPGESRLHESLCDGLDETGPHSLIVGETVYRRLGSMALLEEVCHWGWTL